MTVFDVTAPTAAVSSTAADPTATNPLPFTVAFDEDVWNFSEAGLMVTHGTVSNFVAVDARTYTFDVTPTGDGTVTVAVAAADVGGSGVTGVDVNIQDVNDTNLYWDGTAFTSVVEVFLPAADAGAGDFAAWAYACRRSRASSSSTPARPMRRATSAWGRRLWL